jgi:preprotein translocase subunit SecF
MAVVSGVISLLMALSGLLIGIGRFEANAQAQGAALAELKTGQQTMQHEVEEKRAADRKELIELLDKISDKQDLANTRIQDLAVELASVKATVRAVRHDAVPKEK